MKPKDIYNLIFPVADAVVQHWKTDIEIDRQEIERTGGNLSFLYFLRECGTHLYVMPPAFHPDYPGAGERTKYLFGTSNREELLRSRTGAVEWCIDAMHEVKEVYYFDAKRGKLKKITKDKARKIWQDYCRTVRHDWSHPTLEKVKAHLQIATKDIQEASA